MMVVTKEQEHLVQAERHFEEARAHIARHHEVIQQLRADGHDTEPALSMLHALETSLRAFEKHRALIVDRVQGERAKSCDV